MSPHFSWRWNAKPRINHFSNRPKSVAAVESTKKKPILDTKKRVI